MQFRILGPVEAWHGGQQLALGGPQQRALLAMLLLDANRVVSSDRLIEDLWAERLPPDTRALLRGCVVRLRRSLGGAEGAEGAERLATHSPGYRLRVDDDELDLQRFHALDGAARAALAQRPERLDEAARLLHEALSLWRGPPLEGLPQEACRVQAARLDELRFAALEQRIDIELRLGRHLHLVAELRGHVRAHPLRERIWAQLMLALYAADRQADALAAYRELRGVLVDQLGVDPSPTLQELQRAMLAGVDVGELVAQGLHPLGAAAEAGPPPTADAATGVVRPAQLPAGVSGFTGRAAYLKRLDGLLAEEPAAAPALIVGTAGVGKTALAVYWAHQVRDRFPDGQLWLDLRGYGAATPMGPTEALAALLHGLAVPPERVPLDVERASAMYRSAIADKRVLVVLDNASSAAQVRPLLPGSEGCLALVTSRDRLSGLVARDGAARLAVDVLTAEEAETLLARLLSYERASAEPAAVTSLAEACAMLPLALRIAAAALADAPERTIASYVAELTAGSRLAVLAVEGDEHTAVGATFDLSYARLSTEAQRMFRLLGLVPGPRFTAAAAGALAGIPARDAAALLDRLAGAHLLGEPERGRFAFHDLLRAYAALRADQDERPADRDAAIGRLADFYLYGADAAAAVLYPEKLRLPLQPAPAGQPTPHLDSEAAALDWLDAERTNIVALVEHCAEHGPRPVAWQLADVLRTYFFRRMFTVEWLAAAEAGLAAAAAEDDLPGQAAAELSLGDAHRSHSRFASAIEHYERASGWAERAGWLRFRCAVLNNLGNAYRELGRLDEAAGQYAQAIGLAEARGWLSSQAIAVGNLGLVEQELGRLEQAAELLLRALALYRQLGSRSGEALALGNLGQAYHGLGRLDEALEHVTAALTAHRELGDRNSEPEHMRILAEIHRDAGRHAAALEAAEAALALAHEIGERRFEAEALVTRANVELDLGRHETALETFGRALELAAAVEGRFGGVGALVGLALTQHRLGRLEEARANAERAVELAGAAGYGIVEGEALTALATVHNALGEPLAAAAAARRGVTLLDQAGHRLGRARALVALGHALRATENAPAAAASWREALALFSDAGSPAAADVRALLAPEDGP